MKHCVRCKEDKIPTTAITPEGLVEQCPVCQLPFVNVDPVALTPRAPAVVSAPSAPPPTAAVGTTTDLIGSLRARLAFVESEIAAREGFIAERATLKRMLDAADVATTPAIAAVTVAVPN